MLAPCGVQQFRVGNWSCRIIVDQLRRLAQMLHKTNGQAPTAITLRIGTPQTLSKRGESQFIGMFKIMPMSMMRRIQPEVVKIRIAIQESDTGSREYQKRFNGCRYPVSTATWQEPTGSLGLRYSPLRLATCHRLYRVLPRLTQVLKITEHDSCSLFSSVWYDSISQKKGW